MAPRGMRWLTIVVALLLALGTAGVAGFFYATRALKAQIEQALGPESEVGAIAVTWNAVEIDGLKIRAPQGWPAAETLAARRIVVQPDLAALLSRRLRVARIVVEGGYVSALRSADGRMRVVPSLLEKPAKAGGAPPPLTIGRVELRDSALEFFDATVRKPPLKVRLEKLNASVTEIVLPALDGRSELALDGVLKGTRNDGRIDIKGWIVLASKESSLDSRLRNVDLIALQPYLLRAAETGVRRGTLDLDLNSTVTRGRLRAPGSLTLHDLELDGGGTFMGMPRESVIGLMKDRKGEIAVKFVLDGDLNDPGFRLNEGFAMRLGSSVAETLGVSVEGLARGAGTLGQKGLEAAGSAAEGVGKALRGLFN